MTNHNASFQQLVADCIPFLTDKQITDTINGLSVAKELNTAQRKRHDLFTIIRDGLSGVSRKQQDDINSNLIASLESGIEKGIWQYRPAHQRNHCYPG